LKIVGNVELSAEIRIDTQEARIIACVCGDKVIAMVAAEIVAQTGLTPAEVRETLDDLEAQAAALLKAEETANAILGVKPIKGR
jgi:nucleotide-binding universal stress UspA family protein